MDVQTAFPAFIGYTEKADKNSINDLVLKPTKISSLQEYEQYFGLPYDASITIAINSDNHGGFDLVSFTEPTLNYLMYYSLQMFFANGGKECFIVSVGNYQNKPLVSLTGTQVQDSEKNYGLREGLTAVEQAAETTLIVIPEAIHLEHKDYQKLVQSTLAQCKDLGDRFAIFDIYDGKEELNNHTLQTNRDFFGKDNLEYGAAYYPFLKTNILHYINADKSNVKVIYNKSTVANLSIFYNNNPGLYDFILSILKKYAVVLPPSASVASAYVSTDINRGVWKSPANISLNNVVKPIVNIDNNLQSSLNLDPVTGKSINAIRAFRGKGILIWGARTLAGNDNEWRYVPVRRFFSAIEKSIKKSTQWVVFEPNDANLWKTLESVIANSLMQKWSMGALAGSKQEDAFYVRCGLGTTMSQNDIDQSRLIIEIGMAVIKPAEFVIIKMTYQMKTA
jgi:phage tail sheath protein FI